MHENYRTIEQTCFVSIIDTQLKNFTIYNEQKKKIVNDDEKKTVVTFFVCKNRTGADAIIATCSVTFLAEYDENQHSEANLSVMQCVCVVLFLLGTC